MVSTTDQVFALIKKEWLLMKRTKGVVFQELAFPILSVYLIFQSTFSDGQEFGVTLVGPLAFPLFLSTAMFGLVCKVIDEKAKKYKAYLRVSGASLYSYILANFLFYFLRAVFAAALFYGGVVLVADESNTVIDHVLGFVSLLIYCVAMINFSLAFTTIFTSSTLALQTGFLINLLMTSTYYGISASDEKVYYYLGSLLPPVAAVFGLSISGFMQTNVANFSHIEAMSVQILNCFLYFGLYVFLDRVIPSDESIKDPICKRRKKNAKKDARREQELLENVVLPNPMSDTNDQSEFEAETRMEDVSSAELHEPLHNPSRLKRTVFIENLTKRFGETIAVNGVTMPMFEKQILCLLGHNGAGKTTAINLMTGLLRNDGGNIFYGEENFSENFEAVWSQFGLCVQRDILYENLTAGEHIELISRLRGVPKRQMKDYVEALGAKVGISNELQKLASTLSGGNKRKLSLAMAIAGETKVIFLDEPTSGLDPDARRNFWDVVRGLRDEGKTILLTTHNLDEADELADRIAILSKGKLLVLGTSNFLKKKYGVGYNLIITAKPDCVHNFHENIERLSAKVKSQILGAQVDPKTSHEMLKMTLPYSETSKFADLFRNLETEPSIEIALELNTLEDVFVNIGLQEEAAEGYDQESLPVNFSLNETVSSYKFSSQVKAIFLRRFYCTFKNRTNVLQIISPLIYDLMASFSLSKYTIPEAQDYYYCFYSMTSLIINTVSFTAIPVSEREANVKYFLRTLGLRPLPYWIGNFLFDLIIISTYGIVLLAIGLALNVPLAHSQSLNFLWIMLSFGFSLLSFSYLLSWLYSKTVTVYNFHIRLIYFDLVYLPLFMFIMMALIPKDDSFVTIILFVLGALISPSLIFVFSLFSLAPLFMIEVDPESLLANLPPETIYYIIIMLVQGVIYFAFNYLIEKQSLRLRTREIIPTSSADIVDHIPNPHEILQEEERAKSYQNNDPIKAIDMEKVYDNGFHALRGVSFGVERGQIFGLLGPNGAGKSTTFNILTGLIPKSRGQIVFNGRELQNLDPEMFDGAGICPQFDPLWEDMTVREHLEVAGQIKGMGKKEIKRALMYYTKTLRMEEHLNKKAVQLSGGTKRKLCVAILLIGGPVVQFMDEPSTGLDPMSKRSLYDVVMKNLEDKNASIILTTHSMSEAESLCHKIGILINGKFVCVGNLPYLKSRYGSGYKISVVKANSDATVYERAITEAFSTAVKEEDNSEIYDNYRVSQQDFSFEKAFLVLEKLKEEGHISDFNIINTTLEQVFIQFSRNQIQPPEGQPRP